MHINQIYVCKAEGERNWGGWWLLAHDSSVLLKTCDCDCVDPGVPYRPCLVSGERARGWTQGLSSGHLTGSQIRGAQLAPHAWLAHDPEGWDPCLGHVQSCDPLTNWWECDSHGLMKQPQLQLQTTVPRCAMLILVPSDKGNFCDAFSTEMSFKLSARFSSKNVLKMENVPSKSSVYYVSHSWICSSQPEVNYHCIRCCFSVFFFF